MSQNEVSSLHPVLFPQGEAVNGNCGSSVVNHHILFADASIRSQLGPEADRAVLPATTLS